MRETLQNHSPRVETEGGGVVNMTSASYRHAAPCAPWPWVDHDDDLDKDQIQLINGERPPIPERCLHRDCDNCWRSYPQSRYPNWTDQQVEKSKIAEAISRTQLTCVSYYVDVDDKGYFINTEGSKAEPGQAENTWKSLSAIKHSAPSRTKAIFIERLSGPMLQMLGANFDIEPFFFSSFLNWIPSRFQADLKQKTGDSLTITLIFLHSVSTQEMSAAPRLSDPTISRDFVNSKKIDGLINTKMPLRLKHLDRYLCLDLLSVHVIRHIDGNTIISLHPDQGLTTTGAAKLHDRILFAGQSVYWEKMFRQSHDPTLLLLTFIWHTMYSWDQALEHLYQHICKLESKVIDTGKQKINQELHVIRANQLYYTSLLEDVKKTVEFIRKHKNPAMESEELESERELNDLFLERECDHLILEIDRLTKDLAMQQSRLKNVMNLVFCSVTISDNNEMKKMTKAALRDSAAMKQIAYLSMTFLPPTFMTGVFGMNAKEINPDTNGTLPLFVALAAPLTIVTIWVIIAFQSQYLLQDQPFMHRLAWPVLLLRQWWDKKENHTQDNARRPIDWTMRQDYEEEMRPNDSWV